VRRRILLSSIGFALCAACLGSLPEPEAATGVAQPFDAGPDAAPPEAGSFSPFRCTDGGPFVFCTDFEEPSFEGVWSFVEARDGTLERSTARARSPQRSIRTTTKTTMPNGGARLRRNLPGPLTGLTCNVHVAQERASRTGVRVMTLVLFSPTSGAAHLVVFPDRYAFDVYRGGTFSQKLEGTLAPTNAFRRARIAFVPKAGGAFRLELSLDEAVHNIEESANGTISGAELEIGGLGADAETEQYFDDVFCTE
jgi:hypothetical protein